MARGKKILFSSICYPGLIVSFLLMAGTAVAQTVGEKAPEVAAEASLPATSRAQAAAGRPVELIKVAADSTESAAAAKTGTEPPKVQPAPGATSTIASCSRTIKADVVAIAQPIMLNRLGAAVPDGLVFALKRDLAPGNQIQLRDGKRPRPLVLRANVGDCLEITLTNSIRPTDFVNTKVRGASIGTHEVSLHVQGMEWITGSQDDGSFVGKNNSSLAAPPAASPTSPQTKTYNLYVREEGTFLLYTMGDTSAQGSQLQRGLFGALNVEPKDAEWYRSQVTREDLLLATKKDAGGKPATTADGHPVVDYSAVYPTGHPRAGIPILKMLNRDNEIVHSDLTAMITGPDAGRFHGTTGPNKPEPPCNTNGNPAPETNGKIDPLFCSNPASPDRKQPYREVTVIYHEVPDGVSSQAFPLFYDPTMMGVVSSGKDGFAINYGAAGLAAEVYANRIGVGPMGGCVDCKFEEFFLSAWSVGDPAMLVDRPANSKTGAPPPPLPSTPPLTPQPPLPPQCSTADFEGTQTTPPNPNCANSRQPTYNREPYTLAGLDKATRAYYPDDPSNVYHSYINDHIKFRILHGGTLVSHVHHQHAHQWLQSPNSDEGSYLDSQLISPGASYTLEMTYNGSGNRNKVVGDSIFHCHFYPHFAAGMWAMWRTHDVFEAGTKLDNGIPVAGSRALPDGEIQAGTPTPAIVPLPTIPMAPLPSPVFIQNGQVVYGTPAKPDPTGKSVTENPGFPFFIPGVAGARAPHPPLDFACQTDESGKCMTDGSGNSVYLNGGLPRHVVTGGSISYERHNAKDWSKDLETMNALQLPEDGTPVEKVAINFFSKRCYLSFFPDGSAAACQAPPPTENQATPGTPAGTPTGFLVNGLPLGPQPGAPFADPAVDDNGNPVNFDPVTRVQTKRTYKAAAIQVNVTLNKKPIAWHFPQQRILTLWKDVEPTIGYTFGKPGRQPEPLFLRGNSGDIIEYWHTNLVPSYYIVDDFQVRKPTDILGQHIHLVKFDVTASDGAASGFNYEDGTFSPQEVQEAIKAINSSPTKGFVNDPGKLLTPTAPPTEILDCNRHPEDARCLTCEAWLQKQQPTITPGSRPQCPSWLGAQTTIQRWYLDPLLDNSGVDRTLGTAFTHDQFSSSAQVGLYGGLLIEPRNSTWRNSETGLLMGGPTDQPPVRPDGGPTSWKADILTTDQDHKDISYREFALEFQDTQLAYMTRTITRQVNGIFREMNPATFLPLSDPNKGYRDNVFAVGAPSFGPTLIGMWGSQSVNYVNEPLPYRIGTGDLSEAFNSAVSQPNAQMTGDPITPLLRAYQGDNVQLRLLVGAHMFEHQFNLEGARWLAEPSWRNSGYRSSQSMGASEHFELLFKAPFSSAPSTARICPDGMSQGNCVDYFYGLSRNETGLANGLWGLFRAYDPNKVASKLQPLPNNPVGPTSSVEYATCPAGAPQRSFNISAVTAQKALVDRSPIPGSNPKKGQIVFNDRGDPQKVLSASRGLMYVRTEDLEEGKLKAGVPIEPLILRANAGDCIQVNLKNEIPSLSDVFNQPLNYSLPLNRLPGVIRVSPSKLVGLHPQVLTLDAANSTGSNIGYNTKDQPTQTVKYNDTTTYKWYAGKIDRDESGKLNYTPIEFGSLNLFPSDPLFHNIHGLFGAMIIEPQGSSWKCGEMDNLADCDPSAGRPPTTRASATVTLADGTTKFREFALMISDSLVISQANSGAINYRTEPRAFRYFNLNTSGDFSCMMSNQLVQDALKDPKTPIFTAEVGDRVRFRMMHPSGTGESQVFTVHGHVWQRNPYAAGSTAIGGNNLSQSIGSRDGHGSTDHFDLVIDKAGGESGRAGDYLYGVFSPRQAALGVWGIFRVGHSNERFEANPACQPAPGQYISPAEKPGQQPD